MASKRDNKVEDESPKDDQIIFVKFNNNVIVIEKRNNIMHL